MVSLPLPATARRQGDKLNKQSASEKHGGQPSANGAEKAPRAATALGLGDGAGGPHGQKTGHGSDSDRTGRQADRGRPQVNESMNEKPSSRKRVLSNDQLERQPGRGDERRNALQFKQPFSLTWAKIKRKLLIASTGTPSSGEGRSESSQTSGGSSTYFARRREEQQHQERYRVAKGDNAQGGATPKQVHMEDEEDWEVDQVVVDTEYWDEDGNLIHINPHGSGSAAGSPHERISNSGRDTTTAHSDTAGSLIKSPAFSAIDGVITFFRGYLVPKCQYFFEPRFGDEEKEQNFRKERWYNTKRNAWFGSCFLIINHILILSLSTFYRPYEKVMWYGLYSLFTYPLPVLVAFDLPRKWPNAYSAWCALATCCMGWFGIIMLYQCNFLNGGYCSGNQFLLLQFNAAVFPMLGLFAMSCGRAWIALGTCAYWALVCGLALPQKPAFARQVVNYLLFAIFIQWLHYSQEKIDRRMYTLRMQLKISYRAQQKAQIAEKKANNSKKRFISYIFHEVRVPLNTAYLAFQNLQAAATFDRKDEDQMVEVYALETSLQQVQQVLNDVLDLQRMDAGRFESSSQPFHFHRAINALVASLKVATTAKNLGLDVSLDERIDSLPQSIEWHGSRATFVIGDEIRLRQVLTNLASNAVKFTREGRGGIKVVTKLIWPDTDAADMHLLKDTPGAESAMLAPLALLNKGSDQDTSTPNEVEARTPHAVAGQTSETRWPATETTPSSFDQRRPRNMSLSGGADADQHTDSTVVSRRSREDHDVDIEKQAGAGSGSGVSGHSPSQPIYPIPNHSHGIEERPPTLLKSRLDSHRSSSSEKRDDLVKRQCIIVRIEISDNGPGIKPSDLVDLRLFSPYVQTEVGRTQGGKGSGLGLAIVRAIVQLARGRLGVQSSKNGSTFWLEFRYPLALPSEVEEQEPPVTPMTITSAPSSRPVRPPVKPFQNGTSSWSQYSGARAEPESISQVVTPNITEPDAPFSHLNASLGLGKSPSTSAMTTTSSGGQARPATTESRQVSIATSGGPSIGGASHPGGIDISNPLGSEQWQPAGAVERSLLPSMAVTSATPTSGTSQLSASGVIGGSKQAAAGSPSPPLQQGSSEQPPKAVTADSSSSVPSVASQPTPLSPPGEEAFTPLTREALRTMGGPESQTRLPAVSESEAPHASAGQEPANSTSGQQPASIQAAAAIAAEQPLKVLVVDDDALTRRLMTRMLTKLGCSVEEVEDGQMVLDVVLGLAGNPPRFFDLIICDNQMPVMTGEEAVRELRKAGRDDLFIIGATGNALKSDQESYMKAGLNNILCKPISIKDIKAALEEAKRRRLKAA